MLTRAILLALGVIRRIALQHASHAMKGRNCYSPGSVSMLERVITPAPMATTKPSTIQTSFTSTTMVPKTSTAQDQVPINVLLAVRDGFYPLRAHQPLSPASPVR